MGWSPLHPPPALVRHTERVRPPAEERIPWAFHLLVSPPQSMGRPRRDDRQVLNGIFWILCSGAKWRDLPERYGPWKTVYDRFRQWRDDGTFEAILARLQLRLREDGLMDLDTWMIDSTSIRAVNGHQK